MPKLVFIKKDRKLQISAKSILSSNFIIKSSKKNFFEKKMTETSKKIHTDLKGILSTRFEIIKASLGIQNDAEVVRFLIQYYYRKKYEEKEQFIKGQSPKEDKEIIDKIMEKYGEAIKKLGED